MYFIICCVTVTEDRATHSLLSICECGSGTVKRRLNGSLRSFHPLSCLTQAATFDNTLWYKIYNPANGEEQKVIPLFNTERVWPIVIYRQITKFYNSEINLSSSFMGDELTFTTKNQPQVSPQLWLTGSQSHNLAKFKKITI